MHTNRSCCLNRRKTNVLSWLVLFIWKQRPRTSIGAGCATVPTLIGRPMSPIGHPSMLKPVLPASPEMKPRNQSLEREIWAQRLKMQRWTIVLLCVMAAAVSCTAQLAGSLDSAYGTNGIANVMVNNTLLASSAPQVLGYQSDGKVLVGILNEASSPLRDIAILRFTPDGQIDLTYGDRGFAYVDALTGLDPVSGPSCWFVVDAQDRVVLTGLLTLGNERVVTGVARLTTSGQLDLTFAGNRGFMPLIYDQSPISSTLDQAGSCVDMAPGGKIVVTTTLYFQTALDPSVGVTRLTPDGIMDTSFGGSGQVVLKTGSGDNIGETFAMKVDASGNVFVAYKGTNNPPTLFVRKILSTGSTDTSYGNSGVTPNIPFGIRNLQSYPRGMILYPSGKVFLYGAFDDQTTPTSGVWRQDSLFMRFTATGQADTTFNGTGVLVLKVSPTEDESVRGCDLQSDNKIFCSIQPPGSPVFQRLNDNGTVDVTYGPSGRRSQSTSTGLVFDLKRRPSTNQFFVTAYATTTTPQSRVYLYQPDTNTIVSTFGQGGALLFSGFPPTTRTRFVAQETRAGATRLYVAGDIKKELVGSDLTTVAIAAQRISDGSVDTTWGSPNGFVVSAYSASQTKAAGLFPLPDGKLTVVFSGTTTNFFDFVAAERRNSDGQLDTTFGSNGYALFSPSNENVRDPVSLVLSTGHIFIAGRGQSGGDLWVVRRTSSGTVDSGWNTNGSPLKITTGDTTFNSVSPPRQIVEDANTGSVFVVGSASGNGNPRGVIWKFNASGAASSFGVGGRVRVTLGAVFPALVIYSGLIVPGYGNFLYLGGWVSNTTGRFMFVARVNASSGALDTTWADQGRVFILDLNGSYNWVDKLVWDPNVNRIIGFGNAAQRTSSLRVAIFRMDPSNGALDCFGQLGGVLRRENAEDGVFDAILSGSNYVVATANQIYLRTLRYVGSGQSTCGTVCGNGILEATEQCDDGNTASGDGCSSSCVVEDGFACRNPGAPCIFLTPGDAPVQPPPPTLPPIPTPPTSAVPIPISPPSSVPTPPPVSPPQRPPAAPPVGQPVGSPVVAPAAPPVAAPKSSPVASPVAAPKSSPVASPVAAPKSAPPVLPPQRPPAAPPVAAPVATPTRSPVSTQSPPVGAVPQVAPSAVPVTSALPPTSSPQAAAPQAPIGAPEAQSSPLAEPSTSSPQASSTSPPRTDSSSVPIGGTDSTVQQTNGGAIAGGIIAAVAVVAIAVTVFFLYKKGIILKKK